MSPPLLHLHSLTAGYDGQRVLSDVSFEIPEGALITLIGPNGHGKSTLLKCISGLLRPTAGRIEFAGADITGLDAARVVGLGVVHVPQGDMLFPDMSVYDNLRMGAYLPAARAVAGERLEEIYSLLPRLADRRNQYARTLSGGERRMLALGRGLLGGGRLLMLDEPSLGLAPIVIDQIYHVIETLKASGRTLLLVEENVSRVIDLADRIHLLDHGEIVWQGDGAELAAQPQVLETYLGA